MEKRGKLSSGSAGAILPLRNDRRHNGAKVDKKRHNGTQNYYQVLAAGDDGDETDSSDGKDIEPEAKGGCSMGMIIGGVVVTILLAGGIWWMFFKKSEADNQAAAIDGILAKLKAPQSNTPIPGVREALQKADQYLRENEADIKKADYQKLLKARDHLQNEINRIPQVPEHENPHDQRMQGAPLHSQAAFGMHGQHTQVD